jgi:hypothetical protein
MNVDLHIHELPSLDVFLNDVDCFAAVEAQPPDTVLLPLHVYLADAERVQQPGRSNSPYFGPVALLSRSR